jgi:hypothetical protein
MTLGKASALTAAFVAVFAAGVWTGPYMTRHWQPESSTAVSAPAPSTPLPATAAVTPKTASRHAEAPKAASALPPTAPEVQKLLKPLMNRGTNMEVAAEGFHSAEQFATVAHAAKNTGVPFMVLKHRVLNQGKPLSTAIRESKPDINVAAEASLALGQARRDISSLAA